MPNPVRIKGLSRVELPSAGPEDVLFDASGAIFTGTGDGWIFRIGPDGYDITRIANTGGIPLGLDFLPDGRILICDAQSGLMALDQASGKLETLTDRINGSPLLFCNNAAVGPDGNIFFSQSSTRNAYNQAQRDIIENIPTGRLFRRTPDGHVDLLRDHLHFANGVCVSLDGDAVLVAETGAARIVRIEVGSKTPGEASMFVENLPGLPDNLSTGSDGLVWVAIVSPVSEQLVRLQQAPILLRKLATRIPQALRLASAQIQRVMAFDFGGQCVHNFQGDVEQFHMVTGVRENHGRICLGSIAETAVAYFDVEATGDQDISRRQL